MGNRWNWAYNPYTFITLLKAGSGAHPVPLGRQWGFWSFKWFFKQPKRATKRIEPKNHPGFCCVFFSQYLCSSPQSETCWWTVLFSKNRCVLFFHFCSQYVYPKVWICQSDHCYVCHQGGAMESICWHWLLERENNEEDIESICTYES